MLKITKKILNASLALLLVMGLGGCAATSQSTTHKSAKEPTSAKTVKQAAHHKSVTKDHQQAAKKITSPKAKATTAATKNSNAVTTNQVSTQTTAPAAKEQNNVTQQPTGTSKNAAATNTNQQGYYSSSANQSVVTNSSATPAANNNVNNQQEIQLGLGDVAVWTDSYGITHHVNSDGMDRQTIAGSTQVKYEDWFGPLPAGVQVIHNGNYPHEEIQLGLGDVAVWTDSYGITHHVDSDGMDRQTIAGSSQIHYENWSGALPVEAQVIHNN